MAGRLLAIGGMLLTGSAGAKESFLTLGTPTADPNPFGPSTGTTLSTMATIKPAFALGSTTLDDDNVILKFSVTVTQGTAVVRVLGGEVKPPSRTATGIKAVEVPVSTFWDGRTSGGEMASSGTYTFRFFAALVQAKDPTDGSERSMVKATARSTQATVSLDASPPTLNVAIPRPGAILNASSVTVTGRVQDARPVTVTIDGTPAMLTVQTTTPTFKAGFTGRTDKNDGPNSIVIVATDSLGNATTLTVTVFVDTKSPNAAISFPTDGLKTSLNSFTITGSVTDPAPSSGLAPSSVVVLLDGSPLTRTFDPTTGDVAAPTPRLVDGLHLIALSGSDRAGNTTSTQLDMLVDATAPELLITAPEEGAVFALPTATVEGTVRDACAVVVKVNGDPVTVTRNTAATVFEGTFSTTVNLTAGPNPITISATDPVGNTTTATRTVSFIQSAGTRIEGRVLDTSDNPLPNVKVSVIADGEMTFTGADGGFTLAGISSGRVVISFDPATTTAPGNYPPMRLVYDVLAGELNVMPRAVYLPKLDPGVFVNGSATSFTTVTNTVNPRLAGVSLSIPPGALTFPDGGHSGVVSITEVPPDKTPQTLPVTLGPGLVITVQPEGTVASVPLPMTFPNTDGRENGTKVDWYSMDPVTGLFLFNGNGTVQQVAGQPDKTKWKVVTDSNAGLLAFDWHFVAPPPPEDSKKPCTDNVCPTCDGEEPNSASSVSLNTGRLTEEISTPGVRVLGGIDQTTLIYNSVTAFPKLVLHWQVPESIRFQAPRVSVDTVFGGNESLLPLTSVTSASQLTNFSAYSLSAGGGPALSSVGFMLAADFDGSALATGLHEVTLRTTLWLTPDGVVGPFPRIGKLVTTDLPVINRRSSPYGAGWHVQGLHRLHVNEDRTKAILETDDELVEFRRPKYEVRFGGFERGTLAGFEPIRGNGHAGIVRNIITGQRLGAPQLWQFSKLTTPEGRLCLLVGSNTLGSGGSKSAVISDVFLAGDELRFKALANTFPSGPGTWHPFVAQATIKLFDAERPSVTLFDSSSRVFIPNQARIFDFMLEGALAFSQHAFDTSAIAGKAVRMVITHTATMNTPAMNFTLFDDFEVVPGPGSLPDEYVHAPDDTARLTNLPTGYELTDTDGMIERYDLDGRLISRTDRNGNAMTYAYTDANGDGLARELERTTNAAGGETVFGYLPDGHLETITDPVGRVTTVRINSGQLAEVSMPDGGLWKLAYDSRNLMSRREDPAGGVTTFTADAIGRFTKLTHPGGAEVRLASTVSAFYALRTPGAGTLASPYPMVWNPLFETNDGASTRRWHAKYEDLRMAAGSRRIKYVRFDDAGQFAANSNNVQRLYDDRGNATQVNDFGRITTNEYDGNGNLTRTTNPLNETTRFEYEPVFNQVTKIIDPRNNETRIEYDANGNAVRIFDALNHKTELQYDGRGLVTRSTDARNQSTNFVYDSAGNLRSVTDPLNRKTELTTDDRGNVITVKDPLNRETVFTYDAMNRLTMVTDALTGETRYGYNTRGDLLTVEDALHRITGFQYDGRGRVRFVTNPLLQKTEYIYGPVSAGVEQDKIQQIAPDGRFQNYHFNGVGGCLSAVSTGGGFTFLYDCKSAFCLSCGVSGSGPLDQANGAGGNGERFQYNAVQRHTLSSLEYPNGIQYGKDLTYDQAGNRTSLKIRSWDSQKDLLWTYAYDSLNRLSSQTDWRNQTYTYTYDELSRRTSFTRPNGVKTEYAYDAGSQLTSILHKDENEAVVLGIAYEYDAAGNRTAITYTGLHPTLQGRHEYTYDALNRLISADHPAGSILPDESYAYDAVGNRTSSHLSTTYVYNTANRLLSDDQYTYTYDSVGNLFDRTRKSDLKKLSIRTEGSALFVMDRWTDESGKKRALFQDSLMRKVQEADQVGGTLTRKRSWLHDNEDWVVELEQTVVGNQNVIDVAKVVTHGPGIDEPIMISMRNDLVPTLMAGPGGFLTCASCMQDSYPLTDALGSVLALVDDQGTLVQTYAYDSFGRVLSDAGGIPNDYGYTGREIDRQTGMMFYRARWYNSVTGGFTSQDAFIENVVTGSGYSYCGGNPMRFVDPSGHFFGPIVDAATDLWDAYQNMRNSNWKNSAQYFHCIGNCLAAKRRGGGGVTAAGIGYGREVFDLAITGPWKALSDPEKTYEDYAVDSIEDLSANAIGRRGGSQGKCCKDVCAPYRPQGLPEKYDPKEPGCDSKKKCKKRK